MTLMMMVMYVDNGESAGDRAIDDVEHVVGDNSGASNID